MTDYPTSGKFVCQGCGDDVVVEEECEPWECSYCGGDVVHVEENEVVPVEELEELVEKFNDLRDLNGVPDPTFHEAVEKFVWNKAVEMAENVIEEYTND